MIKGRTLYMSRLKIWTLILFIFCKMSYISLKKFLLSQGRRASVWRLVLSELPKGGKGIFIRNRSWVVIHMCVHLCSPQTRHTKIFCLGDSASSRTLTSLSSCHRAQSNMHTLCAGDMTMFCAIYEEFLFLQWPGLSTLKCLLWSSIQVHKNLHYLSQQLSSNLTSYINGWLCLSISLLQT